MTKIRQAKMTFRAASSAFAVLALFALVAVPAVAEDKSPTPEEAAEKAARAWLALTDSGKYAASWDEAASFFKANVTKPDWERMIRGVRGPLGGVKERKLGSARFTRSLPGAPDGEYVIIQYDTVFEHKASAVETVTPMKDNDGRWRVSGYLIR